MLFCVHQLSRDKNKKIKIRNDGWGDCSVCLPDEQNKHCKGFVPVNIFVFEVKGEVFNGEEKKNVIFGDRERAL